MIHQRRAALAVVAFSLAAAVRAAPMARVHHLEGEVYVERALSSESGPLGINQPLDAGDRIRTGPGGRAALQLTDGTDLYVDRETTLDLVVPGDDGRPAELTLWVGSAVFETGSPDVWSGGLQLQTRSASIRSFASGLVRVDHDLQGTTALRADEGMAEIEARAETVRVHSGEGVLVYPDEPPSSPYLAARDQEDGFDLWVEQQRRPVLTSPDPAGIVQYLPAPVQPYAMELSSYGNWSWVESYGPVWVPVVPSGWRPYYAGYWIPRSSGMFWVSYEPWGWAPYHYGSWHYTLALGWYWIPTAHWTPARVVWEVGWNWVGWCPAGPRGRPVTVVHDRVGHSVRDHVAVPHGRILSRNVVTERITPPHRHATDPEPRQMDRLLLDTPDRPEAALRRLARSGAVQPGTRSLQQVVRPRSPVTGDYATRQDGPAQHGRSASGPPASLGRSTQVRDRPAARPTPASGVRTLQGIRQGGVSPEFGKPRSLSSQPDPARSSAPTYTPYAPPPQAVPSTARPAAPETLGPAVQPAAKLPEAAPAQPTPGFPERLRRTIRALGTTKPPTTATPPSPSPGRTLSLSPPDRTGTNDRRQSSSQRAHEQRTRAKPKPAKRSGSKVKHTRGKLRSSEKSSGKSKSKQD
jgi:hypothetical protein